MKTLCKISAILFDWLLNSNESYKLYQNDNGGGYGMLCCFLVLLAISVGAAAFYYFIIAAKEKGRSRTNYVTTFILGMITLVVVNILVLKIRHEGAGYSFSFFTTNLLKINIAAVVYYIALFEIWSLVFRPLSRDSWRDLLGISASEKKEKND